MQATYLSVLSTNSKVLNLARKIIEDSRFKMGYIGSDNEGIKEFIHHSEGKKHLLFLKPSANFMNVSSPQNLKKLGDVEVIILGTELPKDLIGFVQEYKIAGFISPSELTESIIIKVLADIKSQGYFANHHIPSRYWTDRLPHKFPRPKPVLTPLEEQVLKLLCHNLTVKEISVLMGKNEPAIRAHITNLREKLYAKSLLEIVVIAMANMWIKIDPDLTSSSSPFL